MLTEDNDPTKPAGVLDNAGNVSSSTEASVQHPRATNNGRYNMQLYWRRIDALLYRFKVKQLCGRFYSFLFTIYL